MMQSRNYTDLLTDVIREAKDAGLEEAASALEQSCFGVAFTTSSEMLGEHGIALRRFVKATRGKLPPSTKAKLKFCLVETGLAWPGWRRFLTYFGV